MFRIKHAFSHLLDRFCMAVYRRGERAWKNSPERAARRAAWLASPERAVERLRIRAEVFAEHQILRHRPSDGPVPDRERLIADWLLSFERQASMRPGMRAQ